MGLAKIDLANLDILFIENVGNLICPAEFPLGSERRIVVVSVTEGSHMVRKHPHMFAGADVVAINKADLAAIMGINVEDLLADVRAVNARCAVLPMSCREDRGVEDVIRVLGL
jgi:hydrogenase nickel incorporation protein HypB